MTDIGSKRPAVERTVFSTPRSGEFLELRALQAQTGQHVDAFGDVVVKELLDNALDAAETASREPVIEITTRTDDYREITFVTVTDNGAGITSDIVTRLLDFDRLVSDKARYRSPTRGAQGNAFKTLLGIPYALGVDAPVVIESAGVRHELRVIDRGGDVVVTHDETASDRTVGTSATVPLPTHLELDAWRWAYCVVPANPHATISVVDHAIEHAQSADATRRKPSYVQIRRSGMVEADAVDAVVAALVRPARVLGAGDHPRDRAHRVDVPLGQFISEFNGLARSAKQKAIRTAAPGVTHLSGLNGRDDLIAKLHNAMQYHAKPTLPKRLGPVGQDHFRRLLDERYGVRYLWFKSTECVVGGASRGIIEVAVGDTAMPGHIWFACNHAPAFGDPLGDTWLEASGVYAEGVVSFLAGADIKPLGHHAVVVHVICAAAQFTDKGKVALIVPDEVADRAATALHGATRVLRKEAEQRHKDARKAEQAERRRRHEAAAKAQRQDEWSLKDAVFEVMEEAKAAAGLIVAARTLYYKVRPLVQE